MERGTGACILPTKRIPVAGASLEASRFEQAVHGMDRRIRSWCGGCATSGKRREAISSYSSKKLNLTKARYPIIEKKCLAVVWGIKRFKLYLAGRRFTLQTDHKPLKYLKEASYQNDRVFRWAVAVQEYSFRVEDIPGKENIGADFLSRTGNSC